MLFDAPAFHTLRSFPRKRESRAKNWVPAFAGTSGRKLVFMIRVLDPTNEMKAAGIEPAPRLPSLKGATVGFISNGKEGTKAYFTHVERLLREELGVANVIWRTKSNYSAPADTHIADEIRNWHAVVTGVGD